VSDDAADRARAMVDAVYRAESRGVLCALIRLLGDSLRADRSAGGTIRKSHSYLCWDDLLWCFWSEVATRPPETLAAHGFPEKKHNWLSLCDFAVVHRLPRAMCRSEFP
jgi:hypothetical protein